MLTKFIDQRIDYNGSQLRSHFILEEFGLQGDAIVSFAGKCEVKEHMVDLEDSMKKEFIKSNSMLHFIAEHFDGDLESTILRKRILIGIMLEELHKAVKKIVFNRSGNGIYEGAKKLTVAVATASPVSTLIHAGLNIETKGAPVPVTGLSEHGIDHKKFANIVLKRYCAEMDSVRASRTKVKGVR